jgi:hypothetical protein
MFDEPTNLRYPQDIPYTSQAQFEDNKRRSHPVSNNASTRTASGTGEIGHHVDLLLTAAEVSSMTIIHSESPRSSP